MGKEEINKRVHELLGICYHEWIEVAHEHKNYTEYECRCGLTYRARYFDNWKKPDLPLYHNKNYPESMADVWEIVAWIKKHEHAIKQKFIIAYAKEIADPFPIEMDEAWKEVSVFKAILQLNPMAICLAFIKAIEEKTK